MAAAGWYPDPQGAPGRFRYWDGRTWTAITTTDPRTPPSGFAPTGLGPAGAPGGSTTVNPPPRPPRPARRRRGWLIALVAVVVLAAVIAGVTLIGQRSGDEEAGPLPSSTVSSYDDGPRTPSASPDDPQSAPPTPSSSTASSTARAVACDRAGADQEPAPPDDGRVHGGPLSFPELASPWGSATATSRVPYSRDSQVQVLPLPEKLSWQASAQVGVTTFAPYPGGVEATSEMLQCVLTSDFYTSIDVHLAGNATTTTTVSGRPATVRSALLTFQHPELKTRGSVLTFVVVDSSPATYFFAAVPMERTDLIAQVDKARGELQLS